MTTKEITSKRIAIIMQGKEMLGKDYVPIEDFHLNTFDKHHPTPASKRMQKNRKHKSNKV